MRLIAAVGTRPDVVRVAPLLPELSDAGITVDVAFTGADDVAHPVAAAPFYGVEFPEPTWMIDAGTGTDASTTGRAMVGFESLFRTVSPSAVLVVGDSTTMLAAAISAARACIPVVHLEAGLRCGDLSAPDEVNRVVVARIAAMHLTPSEKSLENLEDEGVEPERIHFVGSSGAEAALKTLDAIALKHPCEEFGLEEKRFIVASIRRDENLRDPVCLAAIAEGLDASALPVLMPDASEFMRSLAASRMPVPSTVHVSEMLPYATMLACVRDAAAVLTDCGALAEEACVVGVPCITIGRCTRQEATIDVGANRVVQAHAEAIVSALQESESHRSHWVLPKRWDRAVSDRVIRALRRGILPLG